MTRRPVRARGSRKLCIHAQRNVRVPSLGKEPQERSAVRCARDNLVWSCSRRRTSVDLPLDATETDRGLLLSHQDPPAWIEGSTRAERQQANAPLSRATFERRVVLGTNVPLSTLASCERWEGTRVVATPLEPSSSLPTLDCARTIVRQRPESPDPLADQFGTDGAADAMDTTA